MGFLGVGFSGLEEGLNAENAADILSSCCLDISA